MMFVKISAAKRPSLSPLSMKPVKRTKRQRIKEAIRRIHSPEEKTR